MSVSSSVPDTKVPVVSILSSTEHSIASENNEYVELSIKQVLKKHPVKSLTKQRTILYILCVGLYFCATMNGYDGSLQTAIETLPEYKEYFNLKESASDTGLVFSIFPIGSICAVIFVWLGDYIGRSYAVIVGLLGTIVGGIIVSATSNHKAYIGGRFILSFFCTITMSNSAMLLTESVPPDLKFITGCYNTFYYIGSIIATWTMYGTKKNLAGANTFKIGLWLQILCPGISLICLMICKLFKFNDSPRYLFSKNKIQQARNVIVKYHANGDENHPLVELEMKQIELSFLENGFLKPKDYLNFSSFLRTKANRKRSILILAWSWFNQFSGNQVITYYMTTLFLNLGIENATTRLLLTGINSILCFIFAIMGGLLIDKLPRRWVLLYSNSGFVISFAVLAGTTKVFQSDPNNHRAAQVGIAFIYIYMAVFFSFAFTPLQPVYPTEIMSNELRARGMAIYFLISNIASFVNLYSAPIAMQNIKYWYYVFFVFWDLFQLLVVYLIFVETCGLTLEEIETVFKSDNTLNDSIRLSKIARGKSV
ncbi:general substrate transporter [Scheffersomyces amazonensis]|uniref:general substrate transporter n=1 Tax=Scheffersomyces amazonensis TaxID=1078765 RepID=UPI00315C6BCC